MLDVLLKMLKQQLAPGVLNFDIRFRIGKITYRLINTLIFLICLLFNFKFCFGHNRF